jgi:hypothetical protein
MEGTTKIKGEGMDNIEMIEALLKEHDIELIKGKGMQPFKIEGKGGTGKKFCIPIPVSMSTRQACEWLATRTGIS